MGEEKEKESKSFEQERDEGFMIPKKSVVQESIKDLESKLEKEQDLLEKIQLRKILIEAREDFAPLAAQDSNSQENAKKLDEEKKQLIHDQESYVKTLKSDDKEKLIEARQALIAIKADYIADHDKQLRREKGSSQNVNTLKGTLSQDKEKLITTMEEFVGELSKGKDKEKLSEAKKQLIATKNAYLTDLKKEKHRDPELKEKIAEYEESLYKDKQSLKKDLKHQAKEIEQKYAKNKGEVGTENKILAADNKRSNKDFETKLVKASKETYTKTTISEELKHAAKEASKLMRKIKDFKPSLNKDGSRVSLNNQKKEKERQ